jgi:tetratricopeptide (TPR) repeat protein
MPKIKKRTGAPKIQQEQEIVTLAHKVQKALAGYRKHLQMAGVAIAVVIVIVAVYSMIRGAQERKASPLAAAAYEFYSPSGSAKPDYAKALDLFRDVRKQYPRTVNGAVAQYYVGNCLANLGRTDEALKEYRTFIDSYSRDKFILGLVYQRMGYIYLGAGKADEARKAFEQAESLTGPGAATFELAKMYESSGNMPEAEKKYKDILEKLAGTTWSMDAMGKVQKIMPPPAAGEAKAAK